MDTHKVYTKELAEVTDLAEMIARDVTERVIKRGGVFVIGLEGNIGVGKTTWVREFFRALGVHQRILSPSFMVYHQYSTISGLLLHHIDVYSSTPNHIKSVLRSINQGIVCIEWSNLLDTAVTDMSIHISEGSDEIREYIMTYGPNNSTH